MVDNAAGVRCDTNSHYNSLCILFCNVHVIALRPDKSGNEARARQPFG